MSAFFHVPPIPSLRITSPAAPTAQPEPSGKTCPSKNGVDPWPLSTSSKNQTLPPSAVRAMCPESPVAMPSVGLVKETP